MHEHLVIGYPGAESHTSRPGLARISGTLGALAAIEQPQQLRLVLDRQLCRVRRSSRDVHLGPTEFRLLDVLMQRPGRVFSREQLLDRVWGQDVYVEIRTVDVHIGRLRKALNRRGDRDPIRTVRSSGYALDETYTG